MKKLKITTIVGTRPEIIRLSRVIQKLDAICEHNLIHTGQNYDYELNEVFFKDLEVRKPDYFLNISDANTNVATAIGNLITRVDKILEKIKPDALLILGDTNSSLSAISAKRKKIPIFHMEAGNRCFDQRVPEEINRKIVDHISDINLTYSDIARQYLLKEGLPPDQIIKTGSPMFEVLKHNELKINKSRILKNLKLKKQKFFIVSSHREENIESEKKFLEFVTLLNMLADEYKLPIIVSVHPRVQKKFSSKKILLNSKIKLHKPFGFIDYISLQKNAKAVLSDSGTITEESSILNFPALNLREAHERPEGMEEGAVMMVGYDIDRIKQGIKILERQSSYDKKNRRIVTDYNVLNVSEKIIRIIHSYIDFVNRIVWKKY